MTKKPRIGILALMLPDYESLFPGITQRQSDYVRRLIDSISPMADYVFEGPALGRLAIEDQMKMFRARGCDGVMVLLLSYSQGQYLVRAAMENPLPLALALVQPEETAGNHFEEIDLTVNQGIHGAQDQANGLIRAGIPFAVYAGSKGERFMRFAQDFAKAAQTVTALKSMRIGVIGKLPGMGDVITDDMAFFRKIGPEFVYDSIGSVHRYTACVEEERVDRLMSRDREIFDVDPAISDHQHREALRMYAGISDWLKKGNYAGYTVQFSEFGEDGRFEQLPLLAASHLMADGYGYAAEGDAGCASLLCAMHCLCGPSNFTEMYMMDLKRNAILFCHAGEGNWRIAKEGKKPRLIDRPLSEGGLANPPTPIFTPRVGQAVILSLAHMGQEHFRLVAARGRVLEDDDLARCEMPYMFFRPEAGVETCVQRWLEAGGTHHEVVVFGDHLERVALFCCLVGIELVII